MSASATPGQEGPSYAPPSLPEGWIAQWDGMSKKYYFVQLSTGVSQWDTPTQAAPTVATPTATPNHDISSYPQPVQQQGPFTDGATGDRSLGSMAMNQILGGGGHGGGHKPANPLVGMATSMLGGSKHSTGGGHSASGGPAGLVGALAGSLLGGGKKPGQGQQQSYSGQPPQGAYGQQGGLMGKLGGMLGGTNTAHQNYGYSDQHNQGGYVGQAPPASYQPGAPGTQSYGAPPLNYSSQQIPGSYGGQPPQQYSQHAPAGQSPASGQYYNQQQPPYGGQPQQQQHQQAPYGAPSQQAQQPYPSPAYGQPSGNLEQPHHHLFQGIHNASHQGGLYGDTNSHQPPTHGGQHPLNQQGGYGAPGQSQGSYY